jgi:hypothetical protein
VVPLISAFLGMRMFGDTPIRNFTWESVYGVGYLTADLVLPANASRIIAAFGLLLWPVLILAVVGFTAWTVLRRSRRARVIATILFACSLVIWISDAQANWLAAHYWPMYGNYFFVNDIDLIPAKDRN